MSDEKLAAEISAEIDRLAAQLVELDLLGEDNPGTTRLPPDDRVLRVDPWAWSIEVKYPEPRLYSRDGVDTIIATRMREDGRYEHAVLDEHGMPIDWRTDPPRAELTRVDVWHHLRAPSTQQPNRLEAARRPLRLREAAESV